MGRPSGGSAVSERAIVASAMQIMDDEGVETITMKRVASTLGCEAMAPSH